MGFLDAPSYSRAQTEVLTKTGPGWWNTVMAAPSDTPTITMATSSQISGGTSLAPTADYNYDPYFRYDGCHSVQTSSPGITVVTAPELVIPEIVTDAADVEFVFRAGRTGTGVVGVRLVVDGKLSSLAMDRTFTTTSGTVYYYKCHFGSGKTRHLKFQIDGANRFDGVVLGTRTVAQRPKGPFKNLMVAIGDSLTIGGADYHIGSEVSGDYLYFRYESHAYYQSVLMGCDGFINLGVGGTGWSDVYPSDPFSNRIATALACNPHVLGFFGSRNDSGKESQVLAAVMAGLEQAAAVPIVLVCGPQQSGYSTLNELVRQGVVAAGRKWINLDGVAASPGSNITGHPTLAEQQVLAKTAHNQLDMAKVIGVVEGVNAARSPSSVTLSTSPNTSAHSGDSVTITATVVSLLSTAGTVQFYDNGSALGSPVTVTSGTAAYTTTSLSVATHSLTAKFIPTSPQTTKPSTSVALTFTVDNNLGFVDHFTRSDGAVGSTENGKAYTTVGTGSWVVSSNKLVNSTVSTGTSYCIADAGATDGTFSVKIDGTTVTSAFIALRWQDSSNFLRLIHSGGQILLQSVIANSATTLYTGSGGVWAAGDTVSVVMSGDSFTVKKNGTNVTGLVAVTTSQWNTKTKAGVGHNSTGTGITYDDLSFVA